MIEALYNFYRIFILKGRLLSMESNSYREEMLDLNEKLLAAEAERIQGVKTYSSEEVDAHLEALINET